MDSSIRASPNTPNGRPASFRDLLRSRQQTRNGVRGNPKSCLPCRERKVKCDKALPCSTCDKRGHPDLCEYEKSSRQSLGSPRSPAPSTRRTTRLPSHTSETDASHQETYPNFQVVGQVPMEDFNTMPTPNMTAPSDPAVLPTTNTSTARGGGDTLFLADNSVVNMVRRRSVRSRDDPARQSAFETGILPLLGVSEETRTSILSYPSLPSDQEIVRLFELFRRRVHPFHVITCNLDSIEENICQLVNARSDPTFESEFESLNDPRWLSLLHAILASGAQFSDMCLQDRILTSQRHTKHAFDLLRSTDYLARPSKEAVQTLLLLGNVLQNDMKPQAAWVLGGTTIRLAQCLGLHQKAGRHSTPAVPDEEARSLRLAVVWQDSLLALAFGRPPASYEMDFEDDLLHLGDSVEGRGLTYLQSMSWLCHITLRHLSSHTNVRGHPMSALKDIKSIEASLSSHLVNPKTCISIRQIQEHYAFELHRHFVISTLCRPFVSSSRSSELDERERTAVLEQFQESLRRSVRAYVRLRSIAGHARRSWAFIHNGLTSVLLLSLMRETRYLPETLMLQDELITSLSEGEDEPGSSTEPTTAGHLSNTLKKALKALKTLRTLAERDVNARDSGPVVNGTDSQPLPLEGRAEPIQSGNLGEEQANIWGMDTTDWDFPVNFDLSPLGAFDYIMSDHSLGGNDMFVPNIG